MIAACAVLAASAWACAAFAAIRQWDTRRTPPPLDVRLLARGNALHHDRLPR